jgi:DNA-binding MarR family transcriptional regulator
MTFQITNHVEFDQRGRATCPSCILDGKSGKNLSLVPGGEGAYKCFRGCLPDQIREALGHERDKQIPASQARVAPVSSVTVNPAKIRDNNQDLLKNPQAMAWLEHRGINPEMVNHYRLGLARAKVQNKAASNGFSYLPAITIPIPTTSAGTSFYQKKRVAPWIKAEELPRDAPKWSQYGIPQMVWITHSPEHPTQTWLCEGEWDAIKLGWMVKNSPAGEFVQVACFTCGAGNVPPDEQLERLGSDVITFYDLDKQGETGAKKVQDRMEECCKIARTPGPKEDRCDWDVSNAILAGFSIDDFVSAAANAIAYTPEQKPSALKERLISNDLLMGRAEEYTDWLVEELLTEDELFCLAAAPRAGKSLWCLNLARAIASGNNFLDRPVTQGSVIYVCCEDSETKIKQRQLAMGHTENLPIYWLDAFKLSQLAELEECIDQMPDLRLIILDTLSRIRDDGHKENSAELGRVLEPLQELCRRKRVCILVTHHTGKTPEVKDADPFDQLRGNSAIRATVRGVLMLLPKEGSIQLLTENGHTDKQDIRIRLDPNTLEFKLLGRWQINADSSSRQWILQYLAIHGSATIKQISADLNLTIHAAEKSLQRLRQNNLITKKGGTKGNPARFTRFAEDDKSVRESSDEQNDHQESVIGYSQTESGEYQQKGVIFAEGVISEEKEKDFSYSDSPNLPKNHTFAHPGLFDSLRSHRVRKC